MGDGGKNAPAAFPGTIGKTIKESTPHWPAGPKPPAGAPNILIVLFGSPVSHYTAPFAFTGRLNKVTVTIGDDQALDGEAAGRAEMARQ